MIFVDSLGPRDVLFNFHKKSTINIKNISTFSAFARDESRVWVYEGYILEIDEFRRISR